MKNMTIQTYMEELSSKAPVPGGGGSSAMIAAAGVALGSMVCSLTIGKKKYAAYEAEVIALQEKSKMLQQELLELMQKDADVFYPLSKAYGMPKTTKEEIEEKERVMEAALKAACEVPLEIMRTSEKGVVILEELLEKGSTLAVSDTGVGAAFLKAAMDGAILNVYINTKLMKDREQAKAWNEEAKDLQQRANARLTMVYQKVTERLVKE